MLQSGLNVRQKSEARNLHSATSRPSVFGEDDEEEQEHVQLPETQSPGKKSSTIDNEEIYDYDGVYEAMKTAERAMSARKQQDKIERKPKYMQNLFEMAEIRKRDRLRAEDFKFQKEREAEGADFEDKEKFVTSAYRAQQEELRKVAEEEAQNEAQLRKQAGGYSAFTTSILQNNTRQREANVKASLDAKISNRDADIAAPPSDVERELKTIRLAEANLGHKILLNDDNQIVDHRQLLGAGLNRPKDTANHLKTQVETMTTRQSRSNHDKDKRREQIDRQQHAVTRQLEQARKREAAQDLKKEEVLRSQAKRTKTEEQVNSAKERYLVRKAASAAQFNGTA